MWWKRRAWNPTRAGTALEAQPNERDLDIPTAQLVSVVRRDNDFIVTLAGGHGEWVNTHTGARETIAPPIDITITLAYKNKGRWKPHNVNAIENLLNHWRDTRTPLQMIAAPGRATILIDNHQKFLPLGRS